MMNEQMKGIAADPRIHREVTRSAPSLKRVPRLRAFTGALEEIEQAKDDPVAFQKLLDEKPHVEKIVSLIARPALLVRNGTFEVPLLDSWSARLETARGAIEAAIRAVGRIEVHDATRPPFEGTGWVIARGVVVTNRHVAQEFARRSGEGFVFRTNFATGAAFGPVIDLYEEYRQKERPMELAVSAVLFIAPDDDQSPDVAFLALEPAEQDRWPSPLPLSKDDPRPEGDVVTIGYPAYDPYETDQAAVQEVFGGLFDVKRVSPGKVMSVPAGHWFTHNCSTLGGSSGSAVLDLDGGAVVGLHFSGKSRVANYAVKAGALNDLLGRLPGVAPAVAPAPVAPPAVEAEPERRRVAEYEGRDGFDRTFLGASLRVDIDAILKPRLPKLAPLAGAATNELRYRHFSVFVDAERRLPAFTAVHVDGTRLRRVPGGRRWDLDPRLDAANQVGPQVYANNDLDKGHMVRRLDPVWGSDAEARQANGDTFHYTNACPQAHVFNDQVWGDLEDYILDSAPDDKRLSVLTGPVLDPGDPVYRGVPIPRQFWKVVAWPAGGKLRVAAFVMTQEEFLGGVEFNPYKFGTFQLGVTQLQELTGLAFEVLVPYDSMQGPEARGLRRPLRTVEDVRM